MAMRWIVLNETETAPDNVPQKLSLKKDSLMIISLHVAKTAGSTFMNYLLKAFPNQVLFDYGVDTKEVNDLVASCFEQPATGENGDLQAALRPEGIVRYKSFVAQKGIQVIHGHLDLRKYLRIFPDATFVVWLREPLARALSHYHFFTRVLAAHPGEINRLVYEGKLSFEQFILLDQQINLQYQNINGDLSRFRFVGIVEEFDTSLSRFNRLMGVAEKGFDFHIEPANTNPEKEINGNYNIDEETKARFLDLNHLDMELYREAVARFHHEEESSREYLSKGSGQDQHS